MTETILITGSNRGVGLALVKEYLQRGAQVIATCRDPKSADDLKQIQAQHAHELMIVPLDINNEESIITAVDSVSASFDSLDVLINNAGINPKIPSAQSFGQLTSSTVSHVISTNAVSPTIVTQAFVDLLQKGNNPRVVMISSQMGSITRAGSSSIAYRMSKSAMNMSAKVLSMALNGVTVITTHPGHVSTDMGGAGAPVSPAQSAKGLANVIDNLTPAQSGKFFNYTGEEIPW